MAEDNRRTQAIQALKEAAARAELSCEHVKISPEACRIIIGMLADPGWISVKDRLPEEQINPNTNDFEYRRAIRRVFIFFGDPKNNPQDNKYLPLYPS